MLHLFPTEMWKSRQIILVLTVGMAMTLIAYSATWAKPKTDVIYKQCACICQAPGDVLGVITDFSNTGGYSCGAYNGKTCNYYDEATGGVRTGTTKLCGGYKPGGTFNIRTPLSGVKGQVLRRGVEGGQPSEGEEEGEMILTIPSDESESGNVQAP